MNTDQKLLDIKVTTWEEGLIAYAEEQKDWDEVERLKEQLRRLLERV